MSAFDPLRTLARVCFAPKLTQAEAREYLKRSHKGADKRHDADNQADENHHSKEEDSEVSGPTTLLAHRQLFSRNPCSRLASPMSSIIEGCLPCRPTPGADAGTPGSRPVRSLTALKRNFSAFGTLRHRRSRERGARRVGNVGRPARGRPLRSKAFVSLG